MTFTRETVADTDPVQQKARRQNLAEEQTAPISFHLECICEAEVKIISQDWGTALENYRKTSVDVTTGNSKLFPYIQCGHIPDYYSFLQL